MPASAGFVLRKMNYSLQISCWVKEYILIYYSILFLCPSTLNFVSITLSGRWLRLCLKCRGNCTLTSCSFILIQWTQDGCKRLIAPKKQAHSLHAGTGSPSTEGPQNYPSQHNAKPDWKYQNKAECKQKAELHFDRERQKHQTFVTKFSKQAWLSLIML